jgi:hypothetical protein
MRIWADEGSRRLRPAEFPALQQLGFHLETPEPPREYTLYVTVSAIPTSEILDEEIVTGIKASADYTATVKPYFDTQRSFTVSVVVMFNDRTPSRHLPAGVLSSIISRVSF